MKTFLRLFGVHHPLYLYGLPAVHYHHPGQYGWLLTGHSNEK
ncbi:hypothetical protein [Enterobacter hormaechei]|nr:hypothetical protein [Enterobacter hormaechei]